MMSLNTVTAALRRGREERRRLLTRKERIFAWVLAFLPSLLGLLGAVLLIGGTGAAQAIGIALLALALATMAIPISPLLRVRVRRREARAGRRQRSND
jgi:hypothetical protein